MNHLKLKNFFILNTFNRNAFLRIISKSKYTRNSQPGLTRYNWDQQDYVKANWEDSRFTHHTQAEELIRNVPPIEVDDDVAMCLGVAEMGWGHPIEWIQLNTRYLEKPSICKYCGLRYVKKMNHHH